MKEIENNKENKSQGQELEQKHKQKNQETNIKTENQPKKKKGDKPYQLIGSFNFVQKKQVTRKGSHYGEPFFQIDVTNRIENMPNETIKSIYVFPDVVEREEVWRDL